MTEEDLDRVIESFGSFHSSFADCFGRKEARAHCGDYVRGLLVQSGDRRNAENLSDVVPASARALQRFLTDCHWDDRLVTGRLQQYMSSRLQHPDAVWAVDDSGFIKQGKMSAGVARQYSGTIGKIGNCQIGVFLGYITPNAHLLVDKELYLPGQWCESPERCERAGIPEEARGYATKHELALRQLRRARELGHLRADWVTGDDAYGESPSFRNALDAEGFLFVLEVPKSTPVWPVEVIWETAQYCGTGRPPEPQPADGQRHTVEQHAQALPPSAWRELTVAEGAQGPMRYLFACERVRESHDKEPGKEYWLVHRRNLDGGEPRYYFSNAPVTTPLETLARVASMRWPIETEFEDAKGFTGLDEYEVRSWAGWHHHITLCLLANAFLLTLQEDWKKKSAPDHAAASLPDRSRDTAARALDTRRSSVLA